MSKVDDVVADEIAVGTELHPNPHPSGAPVRDVGIWLSLLQGELQTAFHAYRYNKDEGRESLKSLVKIAAMSRRCLEDHQDKI